MTAGRGAEPSGAAGGPARHIPVLLAEVLAALRPGAGPVLDATFGAGGYSRALLQTGTRVIAADRDPDALRAGQDLAAGAGGRLTLIAARFSELDDALRALGLRPGALEGAVFDLGVSSMQLDEADRGFSFRHDGPLDMRMSRSGQSAADLVNSASEAELADLIFHFGEDRAARRIARAIVARRARAPFLRTVDLAEVVARAAPSRGSDIHPATRTFQALRIAVNHELDELTAGLGLAEAWLAAGGRLAVVSFHSLEDRIVKRFLAERSRRGRAQSRLLPGESVGAEPTFEIDARRPSSASAAEIERNPRARSAKLRAAVRTAAPVRQDGRPAGGAR